MSKEFVSITLVFESAESMIIPADKIIFWCIRGVTTELSGGKHYREVCKRQDCKVFEIYIDDSFLDSDCYAGSFYKSNGTISSRRRLEISDIAYVELNYKDGTKKSYNVPWHPEEDEFNPYHNPYQHMEANTIVICNDADWEEYKKLNGCVDSDHQNKDISDAEPESKSEPKVGVCDICGKECRCNGLSFINPDGSAYQTWNICDDCAKSIWDGIRMGLTSKLTAKRLPFIESDATELNFLIKQNMIHTGVDEDYIDRMLQMYYGTDTETIIQKVREIVGK